MKGEFTARPELQACGALAARHNVFELEERTRAHLIIPVVASQSGYDHISTFDHMT